MRSRPVFGFSLIELLVTVGLIALLIAIALPAFSSARRAARGAVCSSNMRQIVLAVGMFASDNDDRYPSTMEVSSGMPETIGYWDGLALQRSIEEYLATDAAGVDEDGQPVGRRSVWYDPSDPDRDQAACWGSFTDNGFITGVPRRTAELSRPSDTIFATLRHRNWSAVIGVTPPNPLPTTSPEDPFWSSEYFDMCLDPWSDTTDPADPFHWSKGRAVAPASLGLGGSGPTGTWDEQICGRSPTVAPDGRSRYGKRQYYSFCDGSVRSLEFEETFPNPERNLWSIR
jgi:type II secretory pathway pseudopilin PulG